MSTPYPSALDDASTLPNPSGANSQNNPDHASLHANSQDSIKAIEAKVGTGASTATNNTFLIGNGVGTSAWSSLTSAQMASRVSDETGTGSLAFATSPTLVTPKTDTIAEDTPANGVTIDGLNIKDSKLVTSNSVVTANITDDAVTSAKLSGVDKSNLTVDSNPYKFQANRGTAYNTAAAAVTKLPYNTENFDDNSNYDSVTNSRYTASVAGFYQFNASLLLSSSVTRFFLSFYKNGAEYMRGLDSAATSTFGGQNSLFLQLAGGDYIEVFYFTQTAVAVTTGSPTQFSGYLVCRT
ncbi:MAG: hypothetical protein ABIR46_03165 [Candidatus Saccharimonadales bacterium]